MQRSRRWSIATLLAIGLIAVVSSVSAQSMIDLEVDGEFTGTIAGAGSVQARFFATQGAALRLDVRADSGTTLQPMVVFRDGVGADIGGSTQNLRWLPFGNLIHYVTVPADGFYTARISAVSGDGDFWAHLTGNSTAPAVTATLFGTVTDASNAGLINGATVLVDGAAFDTTDANGDYSGLLTPGTYDMTFQAMGYDDRIESVTMADMDVELNVSLTPVVAASVSTETTGDPVFGGMVTAMATIATEPGVTVTSIQWTQTFGTPVMIAGATTDTATVTLGNVADYKDELIHVLSEPPIGPEDLPPNVPVPEGEFPGGLQDRLQVVAASHFALEKAGLVVLEVEVTTDAGVFTDEVEIHTDLPWPVATGLRNVPIGLPVLLHGVEQGSYLWSLSEPAGSLATLTDETTQTPYFTPDVSGLYRLEVMDPVTFGVAATLEVYAGTYRGVIVGQRTDGTPISDTACTFCHNDGLAPDKFTPWEQTGHSQILGDYLDTGTHNRTSCFDCHATGHNTAADSGGMDDASDYQDFLDAGLLNNPGDNWTTMLAQFPEAARLSNVQCESCHGPQNTNAHGFAGPLGDPRISLSADVCGSCHGEPARHARFPQWQLSGHANYELAIDEAGSGNCSRCHTANGFLAWLPVLTGEVPGDPLDNVNVTWTEDESHPQTCVTCHDPHDAGTSSGNNPDVNIRISGDTPPLIAGFQANDVGRGAVCMTCHNSRRGLRNDSTFDALSASEKARAPHGGVQTDVLMGENAFFVEVGAPGGHATTGDTCVDC
ncbi:MAG: carboxypeptidase regulatory-like domain-containing protein, partial [Acidobacteriota bacterium]|nr:carboxypeptidase regulatory-like domain-containing protein [Acidobacteriota bacterium]